MSCSSSVECGANSLTSALVIAKNVPASYEDSPLLDSRHEMAVS